MRASATDIYNSILLSFKCTDVNALIKHYLLAVFTFFDLVDEKINVC